MSTITKALPREDWEYIHHALESRVRRQRGKLRNARKKEIDTHAVRYLEQDTKRAEELAKKVAP